MANLCGSCKLGQEQKPGGGKPAPGTVWCSQRGVQMGKNRPMPCFVPRPGRRASHCLDCKKAKMLKPTGEAPQPGHVWCEKRHYEINKQRSMGCFE